MPEQRLSGPCVHAGDVLDGCPGTTRSRLVSAQVGLEDVAGNPGEEGVPVFPPLALLVVPSQTKQVLSSWPT